jgi:UDP-GlcNAc3NAcA epimerase
LFNLNKTSLQGEQTALMLIEIEKILINENPDYILVYGDTNSTLAVVLAASKLNIPIIHIEAGLRSFNKTMPEEVNRIIADHTSEYLFCPNENSKNNLKLEGIPENKIFVVGDVMCDILFLLKDKVQRLAKHEYYFATIHRPYNTDNKERMIKILNAFEHLDKKVIFSIHPRTKNLITNYNLNPANYNNIEFIDPVGYLDSLSYQNYSDAIITDSGGMQKEAYMLKKKCITIRSETEWVETLNGGWNSLIFENFDNLQKTISETPINYNKTLYGNGNAAKEILKILTK